ILYFNFNILFVKIAKLNKDLEQTNNKLENRVQKRTAKLKKEIIEKRKIEEELKGIFKTIPDPIVVYNNSGDPLYLNHAFTEIFGWELEDLKSSLLPFVPENEKQLTYDKTLEIYNNWDKVSFETKRVSKMGNTLNVLISAAVIKDVKGMNNGTVVNLKDITKQKIREVQLRQAQKMEVIGTLAGGVAHDFNNILAGIFGYAQLAKMNLKDPEKAGVKIDLIVKGAQRASDLVHQILTISRQSEHVKKPILFDLVVKEAIQFLRATIPSTISIKASIESGAKILADPGQAHQVIMNLCTNAAQAMGNSGGTLSVNLKDISITDKNENLPCNEMSGSYVKLEVKDTGCGIDATVLEKIFDPYFTTKKVGKGTGLGLALVDSIVKKHGGFIKVSSIINDGSKFEVYWPVVEKEEPIDIDVETLQSTANTIEK
ncbi:PAS domain S-box protein, partial [bacterium]|nr:PAS domain S-box protein [bacterium]